MDELERIRKIYHLKNIERSTSVGKRKESPAEHTWSSLVLADYFLNLMKDDSIDRLKVYEMLMYHDLIEIEVGDTCLSKIEERQDKEEKEKEALPVFKNKLPEAIRGKFEVLFTEFIEQKTHEAKFCKAVEYLDAEIHELDYKEDWKGWTEEFLREKKERLFEEFPEMREVFEKSTKFARDNGFFEQ